MSDTDQPTSAENKSHQDAPSAMTNKEKRKAAVAEKKRIREEAAQKKNPKVEEAAESDHKRKRSDDDQDEDEDEDDDQDENTGQDQDQQVVSHKELRRRRKLEKKAIEEGLEPPVFQDKETQNPNAIPPKSLWSVWVGNMSFFTPEEKLKDWFENRGVQGISRVKMTKGVRKAELNRGFAYVDLGSKEMVDTAIKLSEFPLDGRKLLIKSASDFTGRPEIDTSATSIALTALGSNKNDNESKGKTGLTKTAQKILRSQKNAPGPTLFFGNFSFQTTEESVSEMLENNYKKREEWKKGGSEEKKKEKKMKKLQEKRRAKKEADGSSGSDSDSDSSSDSESDTDTDNDSDSKSDNDNEKTRPNKKIKTDQEKEKEFRGAGIRKVRLGQFQDTGKCKGFGFVDFHSAEHATASLMDPRNYFLLGRKLVVEYAGSDAIRRGAPKSQKHLYPNERKPFRPFTPSSSSYSRNDQQQDNDGHDVKEDTTMIEPLFTTAPIPGTFDSLAPLEKKHKETQEERRARRQAQTGSTGIKRREKPGAALANAKRENVAIVESLGKKITFDE